MGPPFDATERRNARQNKTALAGNGNCGGDQKPRKQQTLASVIVALYKNLQINKEIKPTCDDDAFSQIVEHKRQRRGCVPDARMQ
jgi:hypothetical protein